MDIGRIIQERSVTACFQQIISVNRKMVCGMEGLVRGIDPATGSAVMPGPMFAAASEAGLSLELDRLCRERVLTAFEPLCRRNPDKFLFLNVDASILDRAAGSDFLFNQVLSCGILPRNVVIEVNESKVRDDGILRTFTEKYRKSGFLIALDDVGSGFSNIDRILLVKPDIVKIDISLVKNIHNEYHKQSAFHSIINLSRRMGSLVVAEGVETEEEAVQVLRLGGHMIQGFHYDRPHVPASIPDAFRNDRIEATSAAFNRYIAGVIEAEHKRSRGYDKAASAAIRLLSGLAADEFDNKLLQVVWAGANVESAYILDGNGIQISNTVRYCDKYNVDTGPLFYSASKYADHSMEKYYYNLSATRSGKYVTEPYVSLATGNLCVTISRTFVNIEGKRCILCLDFQADNHAFDIELKYHIPSSDVVLSINGKTMSEIHKLIGQMNREIVTDTLTGAYNRRYIDERLIVDMIQASNQSQSLSVIMVDFDHFKQVNDQYGHLAGDQVLREFVRLAKRNIRGDTDWIARYGGEEFLIVIPNADRNVVYTIAEKIRLALESADIRYDGESIHCTASFGTHTLCSEKLTCARLLSIVDKNLYLAKRKGRNRTVPAGVPAEG